MKNLRGVLGGLLIIFLFQFTFVSCTDDNSEIIKSQDDKVEFQKTGHGGAGNPPVDDDEYEEG